MERRSRDVLIASIATALGVSPFACASAPPPAQPQSAVSAREVSPWAATTAPVSPAAPGASTDADAAVVAKAPEDDGAAAATPEGASVFTRHDAEIPRLADPDAVPLALLVPASVSLPPPEPRPVAPSRPTKCVGLACVQGSGSGVMEGNCGATVSVEQRVSAARLGLQPAPGASAVDVDRVARMLARCAWGHGLAPRASRR